MNKRRNRRRGSAAVSAVAIFPLLGLGALVVDIGTVQVGYGQLQSAVDAAALAGVGYLDGTAAGLVTAAFRTWEFAGKNEVLGKPVRLEEGDIRFGHYDVERQEFQSTLDPTQVNAIYVEKELDGIASFFAGAAFGVHFLETEASTLARTGLKYPAGTVPCFLPFGIPECMLEDPAVEQFELKMASSQADNTGWANPNGTVTDSWAVNQLQGQCSHQPAEAGSTAELQNGQMNTAYKTIRELVDTSPLSWNATKYGPLPPQMGSAGDTSGSGSVSTVSNYGRVIEGPMIVFRQSSSSCGSAAQFNGTSEVVGFVWGIVYDVDDTGSGKNLRVQVDVTHEFEVGTGPGGLPGSNVIWQDNHELVY